MDDIMKIKHEVQANLSKTKSLIEELSVEQFRHPLPVLSGSSVGQHLRHLLEFYICLIDQLETGKICYDKRPRDIRIERDREFALNSIESVMTGVSSLTGNKPLIIISNLSALDEDWVYIESNLCRELMYNIEHSIHHQALIKIGLTAMGVEAESSFGVAPSTLRLKSRVR